jgi:hypothetical protein
LARSAGASNIDICAPLEQLDQRNGARFKDVESINDGDLREDITGCFDGSCCGDNEVFGRHGRRRLCRYAKYAQACEADQRRGGAVWLATCPKRRSERVKVITVF